MSLSHPARVENLDVHDVENGLVVYDTNTDRVHYLNATSTVVFELCDGTHTADAIAELVAAAWSLDDSPGETVRACLDQLRVEGVLT